nr:hypothetical protein BHI3_05220 [Bacteriovorax sp. HI3]
MMYSTVQFIFYTAFALLALYYTPGRFKLWCVFLASVIWYLNWGALWFNIFAGIILFNIGILFLLKKRSDKKFFPYLVGLNVFIFVLLKILPEFIRFRTPYGTSFFMLILLGMIIDYWREETPIQKEDILPAMTMPLFFPVLMAGPIERRKHFFPQLKTIPPFSLNNLVDGILIFSIGYLKKFLIVDPYSRSVLSSSGIDNFIYQGLLDTFITYVLFCSYSEMGRGCAKAMGIDLAISFKPFYYAKNPNEFWQRWNITLGTWMRDYVTFPAMFKWGRKISPDFIILFSFLLMGLWHGIGLNWLCFGLLNGLAIYAFNVSQRKWSLPGIGIFLSVCIWIGNGLFQHKDFWHRMTRSFELIPELRVHDINLSLFLGAVGLLFVFEFVQEKKNKIDFFTGWSLWIKVALAVLVVFYFGWKLDDNSLIQTFDLPPVYFRI